MGLGALTLTVTADDDGVTAGVTLLYVALPFPSIIVLVVVATAIANRAATSEEGFEN